MQIVFSQIVFRTSAFRCAIIVRAISLIAVFGLCFAAHPARAQVGSWAFDITNGNGPGGSGNRTFNLNTLFNGGSAFKSGSIATGLNVNVNAQVNNPSSNSAIAGASVLAYLGNAGPTYFQGNDPTPYFTKNDSFLLNNLLNGLAIGTTDNFSLGSLDATAWLATLTPGGSSPVTFTGSFTYTLQAELEDNAGNAVAGLPDITPGSPEYSVEFVASVQRQNIAVPEPGSLSILFAFSIGGCYLARRRTLR